MQLRRQLVNDIAQLVLQAKSLALKFDKDSLEAQVQPCRWPREGPAPDAGGKGGAGFHQRFREAFAGEKARSTSFKPVP